MKTLLLVDDEPVITKGMRMLVDYQSLGIKIIGEANNGQAAVEIIEQHIPDIIIVDIWMPVMDGIELMQYISSRGYNIKVIVLSGYSEFEFAKQSFKNGAIDYILKPVESGQLFDVLKKAVDMIDKEQVEKISKKREIEKLDESIPILREKFFNCLLTGHTSWQEIERWADLLRINFHNSGYAVLIVNIDNYYSSSVYITEKDRELLKIELSNITDEIVSEARIGFTGLTGNAVCAVFNPQEDVLNHEIVHRIAQRIELDIKRCLKESLTIGIGNIYSNFKDIPISYSEACYAIKAKILFGDSSIIHINDVKSCGNITSPYPKEVEKLLVRLMEFGDVDRSMRLVDDLVQKFVEISKGDVGVLFTFCKEFFMTMTLLLRDAGGNNREFTDRMDRVDKALEGMRILDELKQWARDLVVKTAQQLAELREKADNVILYVQSYIDRNFEKELTLKCIADLVYMNPTYFSSFFKSKTGINLVDYITKVRMEKARCLLLDNNNKVFEVAEKVGYCNVRYFNDVFRKFYNSSPTEYRENYKNIKILQSKNK